MPHLSETTISNISAIVELGNLFTLLMLDNKKIIVYPISFSSEPIGVLDLEERNITWEDKSSHLFDEFEKLSNRVLDVENLSGYSIHFRENFDITKNY